MHITVESGVPIPEGLVKDKYHLRNLQVGEVVNVTCVTKDDRKKERGRLSAAVQYMQKNTGHKYVIRTTGDKTLRCWRVE